MNNCQRSKDGAQATLAPQIWFDTHLRLPPSAAAAMCRSPTATLTRHSAESALLSRSASASRRARPAASQRMRLKACCASAAAASKACTTERVKGHRSHGQRWWSACARLGHSKLPAGPLAKHASPVDSGWQAPAAAFLRAPPSAPQLQPAVAASLPSLHTWAAGMRAWKTGLWTADACVTGPCTRPPAAEPALNRTNNTLTPLVLSPVLAAPPARLSLPARGRRWRHQIRRPRMHPGWAPTTPISVQPSQFCGQLLRHLTVCSAVRRFLLLCPHGTEAPMSRHPPAFALPVATAPPPAAGALRLWPAWEQRSGGEGRSAVAGVSGQTHTASHLPSISSVCNTPCPTFAARSRAASLCAAPLQRFLLCYQRAKPHIPQDVLL